MDNPINNALAEREASDWFFRLQDPQASEAECTAFLAWKANPHNAREYARMEAIWEGMEQLPLRTMLGEVQSSTVTSHTSKQRHGWSLSSSKFFCQAWLKRSVMLAGTVAIAWATGLYLPIDIVDIQTGAQETKTVTLSDGSRIAANASTHLTVRYMLLRRTVAMHDGEVFFDIADNRHRPFEIDAGSTHVHVLGTSFNVMALPDQVEVAVNSGRVRITDEQIAGETILIRGDVARIARTTGDGIQLASREPNEAGSWRNGILVVHDETLANVIQKMRRYFPFAVAFDDDRASRYTLSGTIDTSRPVDFLKNLPLLAPVKVRTQPDGTALIASSKA